MTPKAGVSEQEQIAKLIEVLDKTLEALYFYSDPMTYFAIGFLPDHPCGDFMDDFTDTPDLGMKPGKRAHEATLEAGVMLREAFEVKPAEE
jgi:hypothetical protein